MPLVFWDEFDSAFDGDKLGWLRYFLAPMQDGVFQDGQSLHNIGRAIFVFAGGSHRTLDEFVEKQTTKSKSRTGDEIAEDADPITQDARLSPAEIGRRAVLRW